ncbi:MAG: DUF2892 domain-containing protein [Corynebacterium glucuronolyticum]|nr:DUF2892 domain-containing protein [Corynebacterium glucuronolyticum]MDD7585533.1 DUF2892 domain-containing protein [Mycobacteriaceae bacterium]MDY5835281.1 DUF2892 domain-containing protein [Corynebacterium glucuronolyticum]
MVKNESNVDRVVRLVIAVVCAVLAFTVASPGTVWGVILLIVAVVMLVTAAIGWCPLYKLFGINTCKNQ